MLPGVIPPGYIVDEPTLDKRKTALLFPTFLMLTNLPSLIRDDLANNDSFLTTTQISFFFRRPQWAIKHFKSSNIIAAAVPLCTITKSPCCYLLQQQMNSKAWPWFCSSICSKGMSYAIVKRMHI